MEFADDNAEDADVLVCCLITNPLILPDNLVGHCSICFRRIQFRPNVPKTPRKVCEECAPEEITADDKFIVTEKTMDDLAEFIRNKRSTD